MPRRPLVLDELVDRVFSRPLARVVAAALAPTPITPNGVTALAACCGVAGGIGLVLGATWPVGLALAGFLVLDCADGQLARRRGGGSILGRAVDGVGDYVTAISLHVGLGFSMVRALDHVVGGVAAMVAAGLALAWASALLDRYKQRYAGSRDDLVAIDEFIRTSHGFARWAMKRFRTYALRLEGDRVHIPDLDAYRERTRGPMAAFLVGGPTSHYTVLAIAASLGRPDLYVWATLGPGLLFSWLSLLAQRRLEPTVVQPHP